MAVLALTNASVVLNGVDLSAWVKNVELTVEADDLDTTAMSSGAYRSRIGGLKAGTLALTFNQDYAAGAVDATLWSALGTVVSFVVKPVAGATSATNPAYSGSVLVTSATPVAGAVGDLAEVGVTFPTTGTVTRAIA